MIKTWLKRFSRQAAVICKNGGAPSWTMRVHAGHREYHGFFVLFDDSGRLRIRLPARVMEWPGLPVDVYIYDPPLELRRHPHGICLQLLDPGGRWFKLHWERPARTFDQARAYVEQLMAESFIENC